MHTNMICAALGAMAIGLAGCGGGGGGDTSMEMTPPPVAMPEPAPTRQQAYDFRERLNAFVYRVVFGEDPPHFGSVAVYTPPALTNIETTFDGDRHTATLSRGDAGDVVLDSDRSYHDTGARPSTALTLRDRTSRTRYVYNADTAGETVGLLTVNWADDDAADYLAGGYWIRYEPSPTPSVQVGAFIDGPEFDLEAPPSLPVDGTASYRGVAAGIYVIDYGTGASRPQGTTEVGEVIGSADLVADFGASTIRGCFGCTRRLELTGVGVDSATGETFAANYESDFRVHFGATPIDRENGTFQGTDVTLTHPRAPVQSSEGQWAGQLSNRPLPSGDPRAVGGAFGGQANTPDGRALFVGSFAAGHE